jgi:hypothetical protein
MDTQMHTIKNGIPFASRYTETRATLLLPALVPLVFRARLGRATALRGGVIA